MNAFLLWIAQAQAESGGNILVTPQSSTLAEQTDQTFYFIYWVSIVILHHFDGSNDSFRSSI